MKIKFSVNAKAIGRELLGLLVEDFSFAFALTAWIVIVVFAVPRMGLTSASQIIICCTGLSVILLENIYRRSKSD